jgi:DNA mismatch repair protein MutL
MQQKLADFFRTAPAATPLPPMSSATALPAGTDTEAAIRLAAAAAMTTPFALHSDPSQRPIDFAAPPPAGPLPDSLTAPRADAIDHAPSAIAKAIQLHNSYLVVESDEGMLVIDQHALHERILYEDLLAKFTAGPLESQRMLIPQTLRASPQQLDLLEQLSPMLAKLGIDAAAMGPDTIGVTAFPSFLDRLDPAAFMQGLLERGEQELLDLTHEELLHEVLDMMACKAAIKAGDVLTQPEIDALLARRHLVERSSNCPHGRPTTLRLSLKDLEKQFKRTGF